MSGSRDMGRRRPDSYYKHRFIIIINTDGTVSLHRVHITNGPIRGRYLYCDHIELVSQAWSVKCTPVTAVTTPDSRGALKSAGNSITPAQTISKQGGSDGDYCEM